MNNYKYKSQALIEVLIAIVLAVMVVFALVILGNLSLKLSRSSLSRSEATKIAAAGIEAVRYAKSVNGYECVYDLVNPATNKCFVLCTNPADAFCNCGGLQVVDCADTQEITLSDGSIFYRKINISKLSDDILLVTSEGIWQEFTADPTIPDLKSVIMKTQVTNWNLD